MLRTFGSIITWLGVLLVVVGVIIVLCVVPGWLWCAVAALVLIVIGVILIRPLRKKKC